MIDLLDFPNKRNISYSLVLYCLQGMFVILHYAGQVVYDSLGFLVKNKDELPKSASNLLAASSIPLISSLSSMVTSCAPSSDGPLKRSPSSVAQSSVSSQFASQLKDLRSKISQTGPHYIRQVSL